MNRGTKYSTERMHGLQENALIFHILVAGKFPNWGLSGVDLAERQATSSLISEQFI